LETNLRVFRELTERWIVGPFLRLKNQNAGIVKAEFNISAPEAITIGLNVNAWSSSASQVRLDLLDHFVKKGVRCAQSVGERRRHVVLITTVKTEDRFDWPVRATKRGVVCPTVMIGVLHRNQASKLDRSPINSTIGLTLSDAPGNAGESPDWRNCAGTVADPPKCSPRSRLGRSRVVARRLPASPMICQRFWAVGGLSGQGLAEAKQ